MRHSFETRRDPTKVGFYAECGCGEWSTSTTYTSWDKARSAWASHLEITLNSLERHAQTVIDDAARLVDQLDRPSVRRRLNMKVVS